ncbi:polyprenyl synthetase family protein [Nannocystis sp. SCPEA4]|uniref:polyprenyl synthetase family protein n=1 Tax=Nannocystis sp. SCPEA4 TaxID=2996787 RepID=UPI00226D9D1A|nr:polyprenyl synthetase family protein [Nannocystis sp. SCPEA4]MCY1061130.1 polyprenyl synthetase family protein [Nannocystis sp. SCPEA4]
MDSATHDTLAAAVAATHRKCDEIVGDPLLDPVQSELLLAFFARARARKASLMADPAALPLLVGLAESGKANVDLAAGCTLFYMALRLFDDVSDHDLAAPWDPQRAPIADNAALALHMVAVDTIAAAVPAPRAEAARRCLRHHSLRAVAAQHRDLSGTIAGDEAGVRTHNADKSSVFALSSELAAIAAGCDSERVAAHRRIGEATAEIRQLANDLHDLFGKGHSRDLEREVVSYPLAVFAARASAAERAEMARMRAELPGSLEAIRRLLIAGPAVRASAAAMEAARQQVHAEILALFPAGSALDLHRVFVDAVAAELYRRPRAA